MTEVHDVRGAPGAPEEAPCGLDNLLALALAFAPQSERQTRCPRSSTPCPRRAAPRPAVPSGKDAKSTFVAAEPKPAPVDPWFLDTLLVDLTQMRFMIEVVSDILGNIPHGREDGSRVVELDHADAVLAAGRVFVEKLEADLESRIGSWRALAGAVAQ